MKVYSMNIDLSFWKNASSKRKRIYTILFIFTIGFLLTVIGSYIPLSHQDAQTRYNEVNDTLSTHKSFPDLTEYIFQNNFIICLIMFIPVAGPVLGFVILFNTGVSLGAIASVQGYPAALGLLSLVITPVFWLEFTAYSIAMAESIWLFRRLIQRRWLELKNMAILIGICAALLVIGAVVEVWLISISG
jgi:uncharacterized membrane protein SpoIIM required for sporulation